MESRKKGQKLFLCIVVILFVTADGVKNLYAQSINVRLSDQQFVSKNWDNTRGLPVNTVFGVLKDETGFLWAVTEEGLVRFDGKNFRVFNQENVPEISAPMFYDLTGSTSGGVWAANANAIVHAYGNQIDVFEASNYVEGSWITSISEDGRGNVWAGTHDGDLIVFTDGQVQRADGWSSEDKGSVMTLKQVSDGLLIGTRTGLHKFDFDSGDFNELPDFSGYEIRAVAVTSDGNIWAGTRNSGILEQYQDSVVVIDESKGLASNQVNVLRLTDDGRVWAGLGSGGVQMITSEEIISLREIEFGYNEVNDIYISESGNVWLSATGYGIIQMIPADIRMLREEDGLSNEITLAIYQDRNGVVWTGTAGAGVNRIENGEITHIIPEDGLAHGVVLGIYGVDDYIYFGTGHGVHRYNPQVNEIDRTFTMDDGLASNVVQAIYQDSRENVWVTTRNGGIHRLHNHTELEKIDVPDSFENAEFITILEGSNGDMWFSTTSTGILKLDRDDNPTGYSIYHGPSSEMVLSLYEDPEGSIWAGTNEGLLVLKDGQFRLFNRSNGLQFNGIFRMIEDDYGYLWASGNFGIQRMKMDDLLALKEDESDQARINTRLFDTSDGMANHEANGGVFPAGWQMDNEEIWFPTMQGIAIINPASFAETGEDIDVHISSMQFGENEFSVLENVSIPPGVHNVEIHYVSFDYKKPHTINYSYRLRELGDEWQSAGNRNIAYFTSLNPGSYTFEVKAEQFGVESEIASFSFEVEPFFYQSRFFTVLLLLGLFLAGYFVHLFYAKSQQEKELKKEVDEKTKEIQERNLMLESLLDNLENQNKVLKDVAWVQSHELRGPLSKIIGMVDVVKNYDNYNSVQKNKDQLLDEIDSAAKDLDDIIRKLIADIDQIEKKSGEA